MSGGAVAPRRNATVRVSHSYLEKAVCIATPLQINKPRRGAYSGKEKYFSGNDACLVFIRGSKIKASISFIR